MFSSDGSTSVSSTPKDTKDDSGATVEAKPVNEAEDGLAQKTEGSRIADN